MACLGSGYDFKAEMALSEDSSGMTYDLVILHYWKDYVKKHRRVLVKGGVDLKAVKATKSLPVSRTATLRVWASGIREGQGSTWMGVVRRSWTRFWRAKYLGTRQWRSCTTTRTGWCGFSASVRPH